ncbi:MAG: glycosyltransferase family 2 protein [Gemmataceae bacterium]|nr:glycosyltransferase family 2 protein [Gemmataceae bacterium]
MTPFVTIIVPVRNEELHLAETLLPLFEQDYPEDRFEILVIDGRSTDGTVSVVELLRADHTQLHLLDNPRRLSSAARNIGVRAARGEYIVVVDGHCELRSRTYLSDMVRAFERTGADCLGRPQPLDVSDAGPLQQAIALARASRLGHNPGSHIYSDRGGYVKPQSVAVAYRREVFDRVGLFDERFDACEDVEFNHRVDAAGLTCYFAPELAVHYRPRDTLGGLAWQMCRYGRGRARLLMKHPETLSVPPLLPAAFLLGLATAFTLGFVAPPFAALFCLTAIVYSLVTSTAAAILAVRRDAVPIAPLVPGVLLAIHVGAGWGVLSELGPNVVRRTLDRLRPMTRNLSG